MVGSLKEVITESDIEGVDGGRGNGRTLLGKRTVLALTPHCIVSHVHINCE